MSQVRKDVVTLKSKGEKAQSQKFPIAQAEKLLNLSNSRWELDDKAYEFKDKEIVKK